MCFPNWQLKSDVKQNLFREITIALVQQFKDAVLHMPATGFVERVLRLLEKTRFIGKPDEGNAGVAPPAVEIQRRLGDILRDVLH